jgi:hypothetical protein
MSKKLRSKIKKKYNKYPKLVLFATDVFDNGSVYNIKILHMDERFRNCDNILTGKYLHDNITVQSVAYPDFSRYTQSFTDNENMIFLRGNNKTKDSFVSECNNLNMVIEVLKSWAKNWVG